MKYLTKDLRDKRLNQAVAMVLGLNVVVIDSPIDVIKRVPKPERIAVLSDKPVGEVPKFLFTHPIPDYCGNIAVGWPIMKQHLIECHVDFGDKSWYSRMFLPNEMFEVSNEDPLVAAMLTLVASKFGDEIEMGD